MKINQLRGLLGQLQLRHGDLDVYNVNGTEVSSAMFFDTASLRCFMLMSPEMQQLTERSPSEPASKENSDDQ